MNIKNYSLAAALAAASSLSIEFGPGGDVVPRPSESKLECGVRIHKQIHSDKMAKRKKGGKKLFRP